MSDRAIPAGAKAAYSRPELTVYGSVRNLTGGSLGTRNDGSGVRTLRAQNGQYSDARVKHNVVEVGRHPAGFGLYLFDYADDFAGGAAGRQFGVLAQEVAAIMPEAVCADAAGVLMVDYAQLGITRH